MQNHDVVAARTRLLFVVIVIGLPLCAAAAAEFGLRLLKDPMDLMALTGRKPAPHPLAETAVVDAFAAYRGRSGVFADGKTVNSAGFISTPEVTVAKPRGTVRILFLGESSTAGVGGPTALPDTVTWPWQVTDMLREKHPGLSIEFLNAAYGGYTSFESYGRLWSRLRFYEPDVIVVVHGWNEMYYFSTIDRIAKWRVLFDGSWRFDAIQGTLKSFEPLWVDRLIWPSQLLTRVRLRLATPVGGEMGGRPQAPTGLADHYDQRGLEIWRTNLRLIRDAARAFGAELFVAKQATLIVPGLSEEDRRRCQYELHGFNHDAHVNAFRAIYEVIEQEIPAGRIIPLDRLSGQGALFYDHVHPTPTGARSFAELVTGAIESSLVARAR